MQDDPETDDPAQTQPWASYKTSIPVRCSHDDAWCFVDLALLDSPL